MTLLIYNSFNISDSSSLHLLDNALILLYSILSKPGDESRFVFSIATLCSRILNMSSKNSFCCSFKLNTGLTGIHGGLSFCIEFSITSYMFPAIGVSLLLTFVHFALSIVILFHVYDNDVLKLIFAANVLKLFLFFFHKALLVNTVCFLYRTHLFIAVLFNYRLNATPQFYIFVVLLIPSYDWISVD